MNTTTYDNHYNSGGEMHSKLRASTAPVVSYSSHPMALMPGQTSRPAFLMNKSRRMSIADDIRNAHNIPPPPPIPPHPDLTGADAFQPRPPPPVLPGPLYHHPLLLRPSVYQLPLPPSHQSLS
ncbi:hypothetical protein E4T56_gene16247 [Termitomyces sp. T112]|nr:hypothetical protein E4T56_gene16247 [Termitomyces sp. T112]